MSEYLNKLNILTAEQYESATKESNEIYLIPDDGNNSSSNTSSEVFETITPSSNIYTLDLSTAYNFSLSITDTTANSIVFVNVPTTINMKFTVQLFIDYAYAKTLTFPSSVNWSTTPTLTVGDKYIITLVSYDNGTNWFAVMVQHFTGTTSTTVVYDTFTRADSTTSLGVATTGQTWLALLGTWGISSNQAYLPDTTTGSKIAIIDSGKDDNIIISCDIYYDATTDTGIAFRVMDASNYLCFTLGGSTGTYNLKKIISGIATSIISTTFPTELGIKAGSTINLKVELSGTSILCYLNNILIYTGTISELTTSTKHGFKFYDGANARFDNFSVVAN